MMNQGTCDREHDFTLVLGGIGELTPAIEKAIVQAADDATLAMRSGRPFLTFSRRAPSMKDAILSAIEDVRKANVGVTILRVDYCNLVTQSDIARKIGRSRQLVHQFIVGFRGPGGFPPPACDITDGAPLWFWCEVAHWLWENNMVREDVLRDAEEVDVINSVLELERQKKLNPELTREVVESVTAH